MPYLVHNMLQESAFRQSQQEALVDGEVRLNYEQFVNRAASLAQQLVQQGVRRGDRVAIYMPPDAELALSIFAASFADAVFVPIHHGLFPGQVDHIVRDSGATAIITDNLRWSKLSDVIPDWVNLHSAIIKSSDSEPAESTSCYEGICMADFDESSNSQSAGPAIQSISHDLAAILYTSGSTGRPKGVMLSHSNIVAGAEIVSDYLGITNADRLLAALPFSFDAGLNQLTSAVLRGGSTVMIEFRFGTEIVRKLVHEQITGLAGVPTLWSLLAQPSSGLGKRPLPHLRYITNTGGAMPQNILSQLRTLLPTTDVYLMYGLTEAFRSTYLPPDELDRRPTSMGRAIPNTEIMILNEQGQPCGPDEVGELVHRGPTVSLGYWGHPELSANVLRPHPFPEVPTHQDELVCYSGDLVRKDKDGFLYFVGRRDNQIKSSGFRISPTEVEEALSSVAPLRQVAVIGIPDPALGQRLVAFAVPAENSDPLAATEILSRCAGVLPRHMVPKSVHLMDDLPQTSSGKVNYPELRRLACDPSSQTQNSSR